MPFNELTTKEELSPKTGFQYQKGTPAASTLTGIVLDGNSEHMRRSWKIRLPSCVQMQYIVVYCNILLHRFACLCENLVNSDGLSTETYSARSVDVVFRLRLVNVVVQ